MHAPQRSKKVSEASWGFGCCASMAFRSSPFHACACIGQLIIMAVLESPRNYRSPASTAGKLVAACMTCTGACCTSGMCISCSLCVAKDKGSVPTAASVPRFVCTAHCLCEPGSGMPLYAGICLTSGPSTGAPTLPSCGPPPCASCCPNPGASCALCTPRTGPPAGCSTTSQPPVRLWLNRPKLPRTSSAPSPWYDSPLWRACSVLLSRGPPLHLS